MSGAYCLIAYHGCDITVRDDLVKGRIQSLDQSRNAYDWLGPGSYFFEGDAKRALMFAEASKAYPERRYTRLPIATPAAVGAVLCVSSWLDMTTQVGIAEFAHALDGFRAASTEMPMNAKADEDDADVIHRALDNAVFTFLHEARQDLKLAPFDAIRGAFPQGPRIVERSGFRRHTHVQLAVRNSACVRGWFLPPGETLMDEKRYATASAELQRLVRNGKPRKRLPPAA